jgi:hypothetical protein
MKLKKLQKSKKQPDYGVEAGRCCDRLRVGYDSLTYTAQQ